MVESRRYLAIRAHSEVRRAKHEASRRGTNEKLIADYLFMIHEVKNQKLSQDTLGFIGNGNLYVFGKCRDEYTNVYVRLNPKISSSEINEFMDLLRFVFVLVRNQSCIPMFLERFNIVIDIINPLCSTPFILQFLDRLRNVILRYFPFSVNRIIILGNLTPYLERYQDFKKKVSFMCEVVNIQPGEANALLDIISSDQLEEKYGGSCLNIQEYWPPISHTNASHTVTDADLAKARLVPFFIYDEDVDQFKKQHLPSNDVNINYGGRSALASFTSNP